MVCQLERVTRAALPCRCRDHIICVKHDILITTTAQARHHLRLLLRETQVAVSHVQVGRLAELLAAQGLHKLLLPPV